MTSKKRKDRGKKVVEKSVESRVVEKSVVESSDSDDKQIGPIKKAKVVEKEVEEVVEWEKEYMEDESDVEEMVLERNFQL